MSGNNSLKEEADVLLNKLFDMTGADSSTMFVGSGPGHDLSGAITPHLRAVRNVLLADGLIWESRRMSIGITDKGIAAVQDARKGEVLKMEIDSLYPTTAEGIVTELGYWVRRQQDGDPGSNHWIQVQARIDHLRYLDRKTLEENEMKSKSTVTDGLSLAPAKALGILEGHIAEAEKLRTEKSSYSGRSEWTTTAASILHQAFKAGDPIFKAFSMSQNVVTRLRATDEESRQTANGVLDSEIAVLRSAVKQLTWSLPETGAPAQSFMPAGSQHDAFKEIRAIIKTAKQELFIVDNYVDETLWALLSNLTATAKVRVMTMKYPADFSLEGKTFAAQHKNVIEVRAQKSYHDRFIVVDGATVWHLGASIKDAGAKAFAMSEILAGAVKRAAITDIENTWSGATAVKL